jgi:hypothetical protein
MANDVSKAVFLLDKKHSNLYDLFVQTLSANYFSFLIANQVHARDQILDTLPPAAMAIWSYLKGSSDPLLNVIGTLSSEISHLKATAFTTGDAITAETTAVEHATVPSFTTSYDHSIPSTWNAYPTMAIVGGYYTCWPYPLAGYHDLTDSTYMGTSVGYKWWSVYLKNGPLYLLPYDVWLITPRNNPLNPGNYNQVMSMSTVAIQPVGTLEISLGLASINNDNFLWYTLIPNNASYVFRMCDWHGNDMWHVTMTFKSIDRFENVVDTTGEYAVVYAIFEADTSTVSHDMSDGDIFYYSDSPLPYDTSKILWIAPKTTVPDVNIYPLTPPPGYVGGQTIYREFQTLEMKVSHLQDEINAIIDALNSMGSVSGFSGFVNGLTSGAMIFAMLAAPFPTLSMSAFMLAGAGTAVISISDITSHPTISSVMGAVSGIAMIASVAMANRLRSPGNTDAIKASAKLSALTAESLGTLVADMANDELKTPEPSYMRNRSVLIHEPMDEKMPNDQWQSSSNTLLARNGLRPNAHARVVATSTYPHREVVFGKYTVRRTLFEIETRTSILETDSLPGTNGDFLGLVASLEKKQWTPYSPKLTWYTEEWNPDTGAWDSVETDGFLMEIAEYDNYSKAVSGNVQESRFDFLSRKAMGQDSDTYREGKTTLPFPLIKGYFNSGAYIEGYAMYGYNCQVAAGSVFKTVTVGEPPPHMAGRSVLTSEAIKYLESLTVSDNFTFSQEDFDALGNA